MTLLTLQKRVELIAILTKTMEYLQVEYATEKYLMQRKKEVSYTVDYTNYTYKFDTPKYTYMLNPFIYSDQYMQFIEIEKKYKYVDNYLKFLMSFAEFQEEDYTKIMKNVGNMYHEIKVDKYDLLRAQEKLIPF